MRHNLPGRGPHAHGDKPRTAALIVLALLFMAGESAAAGGIKRIVGRVVSIEGDTLVVRTRRAETVAIEIDAATKYLIRIATD